MMAALKVMNRVGESSKSEYVQTDIHKEDRTVIFWGVISSFGTAFLFEVSIRIKFGDYLTLLDNELLQYFKYLN